MLLREDRGGWGLGVTTPFILMSKKRLLYQVMNLSFHQTLKINNLKGKCFYLLGKLFPFLESLFPAKFSCFCAVKSANKAEWL